jgi:hypothetical protein
MEFDNPDAIIRISMEIEDHVEQSLDKVAYEGGWIEREKADIGHCVGVHVADVLQRLLGDGHRLESACDAIIMCIKERREDSRSRSKPE